MSFKKILIILLFLCILSLNAVSASDDNDFTITDDYDIESPTGETTFEYVQKAVDNAKENDVIELEGVYTGNITIQSNKSITLEGIKSGATFDGSHSNQEDGIFMVFNDDDNNTKTISVTLKNLNFINYSAGYSAVSVWDNVNLKVINCSFINCNSNKNINDWLRGGAIGCVNKYCEITNCTFINCSSESGGAIDMSSEEYMIDSCEFINCTADAGGAVYLGSKGNIKNTNFINNHANTDGGAVYGEISEVNVDNCTFKNNIAQGFGAAIYAYSYDDEDINDHDYNSQNYHLTVTDSKFTKNIAWNKTNILTILENNQCMASNDIFIYGDDPQIYTENSTKIKFNTPKIKATLKLAKLSTKYNSGKKFKVTLTDSDNNGLGYIDLAVKVYTGKKSITYYLTTDYNGITVFEASLLSPGNHKVVVSASSEEVTVSKKTSSIKIYKASTTVKAPKVTNNYKKSKYFKITVKSNKKPVKNIKLKVKVFNGKKYKIYTIKTNKKGMAKLNTKSLNKGTHKVIISSGNKNYKISAKSSIKIK